MKHFTILFIFSALILIPIGISAHGEGVYYEEVVGEYLVDIEYDPEIIDTETTVRFEYGLLNEESGESVDFTSIWFRIIKGKETLIASGIHKSDFGPTTLLYRFPESGTYEISARFQKDDDSLAEVSFPLEVASAPSGDKNPLFLFIGIFLGGFALGGLLVSIINRKKLSNVTTNTV